MSDVITGLPMERLRGISRNTLEKIIPCSGSNRKWSRVIPVPELLNDFFAFVIDAGSPCAIVRLYMKGKNPSVENVTSRAVLAKGVEKCITGTVLTCFKDPIKEVYFILNNEEVFKYCIACRNPDGELTVTVY